MKRRELFFFKVAISRSPEGKIKSILLTSLIRK